MNKSFVGDTNLMITGIEDIEAILLLIKRGHIYIFIFVPVWQKNNMSLTPVSQVKVPALSSPTLTLAYQWNKGYSMDRQRNKTLEISSRRASSFFNFKESRLNRDRRPRVPASLNNNRIMRFRT